MGDTLNKSGDLIPADDLYEACRVMAKHVTHKGGVEWDFSKLMTMPIDPAFTKLVESYLASVLTSASSRKGWKLPETTLIFPWIVRMFPDAYYINWMRDPRDGILGNHLTDDLSDFGIPYDKADDERERRAISWKYQVEIVKATPKPKRFTTVRLEDFVLKQEQTLGALESFLGFPLVKIPVKPEVVGRWKADQGVHDFDFFRDDLVEFKYVDGKRATPRSTRRRARAKASRAR
jgi:hypothetical protein